MEPSQTQSWNSEMKSTRNNKSVSLVQEIIPWDERSADVTPSTRSLQPSNDALAVNYIDDFDSVVKQYQGYIQKVRGFFKAPESGEYKFYSSCSGPCQIFIGQDEKSKPKQIIAQKEESLHNEFNRYPDQVSHTIYLEQGRLYFIEGIEKQHGGLGHLSVGVVLPSDRKILPISKSYLQANKNGDLKRKGEILRSNGKELTKQRDKMFTKLKEINEYIRKLTDAVKRNPTISITRDSKSISRQKTDRSGEFHKSINEESNEVNEMEQLTPMEKMGESIKVEQGTAKETKGDEIKVGEIKNEYVKNEMNSIDEHQSEIDKKNKKEKEASQEPIDTNEYIHQGNVESESIKDVTPKEIMGLKSKQYVEERRKKMQEMEAQRKNNEAIQTETLHDHLNNKNDRRINITNTNIADNTGLFSAVGKTERNTDSVEIQNGKGNITAEIENDVNQNNVQIKSTRKPGDDVIIKENYANSRSRGHTENVQSKSSSNMKSGAADDDDNDEIIQLTNYAKKEISKHGDLSEHALKNLIKVIKNKLISDGYVKKQHENTQSSEPTQHVKTQFTKNTTVNQTSRNKTDVVTEPSEKSDSKNLREGQLMLYDRVVSNLMKIIKESTRSHGNKQDYDANSNDILKSKSEMINNEKDQRARMLSSLYLLSNEIEHFKQFLKENKKKNLQEQPGFESEHAGKLKGETTEGKASNSSSEKSRFENSIDKFATKWSRVQNELERNNGGKLSINDDESENRYKDIRKYKAVDNVINDGKESSIDRYNTHSNYTQHDNSYGQMTGASNEIKLRTDDAKVRPQVSYDIEKNITPDGNSEEDDQRNVEMTRNAKGLEKQVSSKPLFIDGYTQLVTKVSGQSRNNEQNNEERYGITETKTTQPMSSPIAANASKRNSYTDTLTRSVEQYLSGMTVPALLGEQVPNAANTPQGTNYQYTRAHDLQRDRDVIHPSSQIYQTPMQNVQGSKKTLITKRLKRKTSKRKLHKDKR